MQAYLAEKYMSGPKADAILSKTTHIKKKKRKVAPSATTGASNAMIVDHDGGWGNEPGDDNDDLTEAVIETDRSFKKRKAVLDKSSGGESSGWTTVREGAKQETPPPEDEQPQVVGSASFAGGLVTSSQLKNVLPQKGKEKARLETEEEREQARLAQETVYRDASGRKIDTKAERAEAARKKREREELEARKMEWGKGVVQREDEARRREQLLQESRRDLAVYADDRELNEEQKAKERWNDPAMAFLTKKRSKGPKKPEYAGPPPPPNRFGIKPGYRWDGVDRGNGFEKKLFQKQNERKRTGLESYQWSVDDM